MSAENSPAAEVDIDATLVRALLAEQLPDLRPDLADLDVVEIAAGWDNVLFRLGTDLSVRLPRRAAAATLIENEQRWLPRLAARLPLPVPAPSSSPRRGGPVLRCGCTATCGRPTSSCTRGVCRPSTRSVFRAVVDADDATWARAQGWALALGVAYVASSADDPRLAREGRAVIDAVLADTLGQ